MEAIKLARSNSVQVETRVLLHDMKVKIRLFDGYDWPKSVQCPPAPNATSLFIIDKPPLSEENESKVTSTDTAKVSRAPGKKAELLGGLLEGANENESTFGDMPLPEDRVKSLRTQAELRRLSRRTNTYVQFSASAVRLRMDSYAVSGDHQLNSCLSLSLGDFFLAETISNPRGPVKMMGEWFSENLHPRDSSEGLLMLKVSFLFASCSTSAVRNPPDF
jgi:hypothetical protein